jgi:hypothetical protein
LGIKFLKNLPKKKKKKKRNALQSNGDREFTLMDEWWMNGIAPI